MFDDLSSLSAARREEDERIIIFVATMFAGFGQDLAFSGSLAEVNAIAPPRRRGDIDSSYYVVIYVGVAFPIIGVGIIAMATGLLLAAQIFAYIILVASISGLVAQRLDASRPNRLTPSQ